MTGATQTVMERRNDAFRALLLAPVLIGAGLLGLLVQIPEAALELSKGRLAAFAVTIWGAAFVGGIGLILSSFWFFSDGKPVSEGSLRACALISITCSALAFWQAILIVAAWMNNWPEVVSG